jgi:predicted ferric reductase
MKYGLGRALFWIASYLTLVLAPLAVAYHGPAQPRGFWIEFSVGLGFVGLAMMGWQFILTGRLQRFGASFGLDSMLQYHRQISLVAVVFILAHPLILFMTDAEYLAYLDPRVDFLRALALAAVMGALILLVATSVWRLNFGLSYENWRVAHGVLATLVLFIGVTHILQVGYYVAEAWKQTAFVGMSAAAVLLLVNSRLIRPWRMRRRPYRVREVRPERSEAWTLALEPDGHEGIRFRPGQFAWITLQKTPFSLQQHPYSFSSSAELAPEVLEFTVKPEGDFSSTVEHAESGWSAFLEGPYGYFIPERDPDRGSVMIAGGVGITPMMSMLRTFADREDCRDLHLIYMNISLDDVIFHDELSALDQRLNLTLTHVLEEPPEGWEGETGLLDRELLERHLPEDREAYEYFICGPKPMMDIAEASLLEMGIRQRRILSERFNMV